MPKLTFAAWSFRSRTFASRTWGPHPQRGTGGVDPSWLKMMDEERRERDEEEAALVALLLSL